MAISGDKARAQLQPSLDASQIPNANASIHDQIREYYGSILAGSDDLKTNACCCTEEAPPKYVIDALREVSDDVIAQFYGCGSPIPPALEGCTVVDLGCGSGRDVYALSKLVGQTGRVIGVDMTQAQLDVASKYLDEHTRRFGYSKPNVEFRCGYIEDLVELGIEDESVDLVISNCVINLTPFKEQVLREVYRVLKPGGELYFSDVFCDRRMPEELRSDPVLRGECLGGAIYIDDFRRMMHRVGWSSFLYTSIDDIHISDLAMETKIGFTGFTSRTVRAIKALGLEDAHENFGQTARYLGTISETPRYFDLTDQIRLIKGRDVAVSGNMAAMLEQSRYGKHFAIQPRGQHRGAFDFKRAQDAVAARRGRKTVDLGYLNAALDRIGEPSFSKRVNAPLVLTAPEEGQLSILQVNITYACNLACRHCYLECSPKSQEYMSRQDMQLVLDSFDSGNFKVLDITGGSPELHSDFSWFLAEGAKRAKRVGGYVIVRSNLTLLNKPEYAHFMQEFADAGAHVTASIPYFDPETMDSQRGRGAFESAMQAIRKLNKLGYGVAELKGGNRTSEGELQLDLVYNVSGPFLPPPQDMLADLYHDELERREGIVFDNLFAFNNYPLGRFGQDLLDANMFDEYLKLLVDNFNALAVQRMMCRDQVNVDVDGRLYDCEVNHVLGLPIRIGEDDSMRDATLADLASGTLRARNICTHPVCYSCSAGFGSSCGGSLVASLD
ncbi:arsenosugar biosynthesis radical SAM (seleno)protein ArsS [Adlercreutzia sp. ZJ154]|uniref:arsenosugar biosynthesis radical SAM (seleno)protein ArsS n=1 Tax=Adlercreutzia sp. ZJ154 TaxID=2709790 RepID=UPI0013EA9045|nr:arsenosugar biosynthesis radical SAM (seleno)protein ArsS [Adlercreutzia sp. ZJ154]